MLEQISARIVFMLLDVSLKAILMGALAVLVMSALRRLSVHAQHRVWTVVLLALLLLPLLGLTGLSWSLPLAMWPRDVSAVKSSVASSPSVSASSARGRLDDRHADFPGSQRAHEIDVEAFPGRTGNNRPQDSLAIPLMGTSDGEKKGRRLANGPVSFEVNEPHTSPVDSVRPQQLPQWRSPFVIGSMVWLAGVGVMLVRLLIAVVQSLQFKRSSHLVEDCSLPVGIMVRESDRIDSPVVMGWWQTCILLPRSWRDWTSAKREAVFSHELSHLRRGDTHLSLLAELATLFYWFHPVSWLTKRKLGQLAELACDEAAAVAIGNRVEYARYLVEIAAANRQNARFQLGTAMARSSEIGQRVRALLDLSRPMADRISWPSRAMIFLLGMPAAILLAAVQPTAVPSPEKAAEFKSVTPPKAAVAPKSDIKDATESKKSPSPVLNQTALTDDPVFTLRGTLLMPDGSVAKDAVLEQPEKGTSDVLRATITEGQFEIRTTGRKLNNPSILCRSPDWNLQASLLIRGHTLRSMCVTPLRVTLTPTKVIRVKVTDHQQAVADAHVQVDAGSFKYFGRARADGVAELKIPQNEEIFLICAWTDDHKIGGLHAARKPTKDQFGTDFQIEVSRDAPVRVRAVDTRRQPVKNVPLTFTAVTGDKGSIFVGDNPTSLQTTNEQGEAIFAWVPNWPDKGIFFEVAENSQWRRIGEGNLKKLPDGTHQLEVAPARTNERILVESRLSGVTTDVSGMLVEFWSFQGEEESTSDVIYSRTDAHGRFKARVLPGSNYSVFVNDTELVSNNWGGVIALAKGATIRQPELKLSKGVSVEIQVTKGRNQEPLKNAWVGFEEPQESRHGRRFWGKTDDLGRCTVPVNAGELEIRVSEGDWEQRKTIQIVEGQPAKIHLHRKYTEKQAITGKLVLPAGVTADLSKTTVKIAGMDGESEDATTVTADAHGNFTAGIIAGRISILAMSPEEKFFGCAIVNIGKDPIEVPFHPTIPYGGQVLGPEEQPLPGVKVSMMARLIDQFREYPPKTPDFRKQYVELFRDRIVTTDKDGYFVFPTAPQRIELTIRFTRPGEAESARWTEKWFEPGDQRPREVIRIRSSQANSATAPKPIGPGIAGIVNDCRLAGIHALIVVSGAGEIVAPFVKTHVLDAEEPRDIDSFYPVTISGPEAAVLPDRQEYFAAHQWPFPETNSIFLAAINGDGKELGRLTLELKDDQAAAKDVAAFIKKHLPPRHDAKAGYEAALAEAKRSGRRLWVRVGQTRCAPCFSLSRWLDSQRELLAKDYVLFKFDNVRDLHGQELSVALKFDAHGVPCHAILDSDGKELINSIGPLGNIGDPSGDFEGTNHLRKMLKTTAQQLTNEEIELLIRSLARE